MQFGHNQQYLVPHHVVSQNAIFPSCWASCQFSANYVLTYRVFQVWSGKVYKIVVVLHDTAYISQLGDESARGQSVPEGIQIELDPALGARVILG